MSFELKHDELASNTHLKASNKWQEERVNEFDALVKRTLEKKADFLKRNSVKKVLLVRQSS